MTATTAPVPEAADRHFHYPAAATTRPEAPTEVLLEAARRMMVVMMARMAANVQIVTMTTVMDGILGARPAAAVMIRQMMMTIALARKKARMSR